MKPVAELLDSRRHQWTELESLCHVLEKRWRSAPSAETLVRFAHLYRAACADLALADSYQLPEPTIAYLHRLVARAHNQLYRSKPFHWHEVTDQLFRRIPHLLFRDPYLRLSFLLFWGIFLTCMMLASQDKDFAETLVGQENLSNLEEMHSQPLGTHWTPSRSTYSTGFYVRHNASIGLTCFALGVLGGVGGLFVLISNAVTLGTMFGYMTTVDNREYFFEFVTAHGPFELTAVVLAAAAGMRLGFAVIATGGYSRVDSLKRAGQPAVYMLVLFVILFCLAAFIEGYLSPSGAPYELKVATAIVSTVLLIGYVVGFGLSAELNEKSLRSSPSN